MAHTLGRFVPYFGFAPTGDFGPLTVYTAKNGKTVYFLKAPPLVPATLFQKRQRTRFKNVATLWWQLTQEKRDAWLQAAKSASLYCTGYNLFLHWQLRRDVGAIRTIERITGQVLL
jgi:hypothetical protein